MSDVGIISINKHSLYLNYGAALHSFAFQKYLNRLGGGDNSIVFYQRFTSISRKKEVA